jgi:hypothetical protein
MECRRHLDWLEIATAKVMKWVRVEYKGCSSKPQALRGSSWWVYIPFMNICPNFLDLLGVRSTRRYSRGDYRQGHNVHWVVAQRVQTAIIGEVAGKRPYETVPPVKGRKLTE